VLVVVVAPGVAVGAAAVQATSAALPASSADQERNCRRDTDPRVHRATAVPRRLC
jgi:hypothetical protein